MSLSPCQLSLMRHTYTFGRLFVSDMVAMDDDQMKALGGLVIQGLMTEEGCLTSKGIDTIKAIPVALPPPATKLWGSW